MQKISIAMYSTFKQPGWKSARLEKIVPLLEKEGIFNKGYGLRKIRNYEPQKNIEGTYWPIIGSIIAKKLSDLSLAPNYLPYLVGEYLTGLIFKKRVSEDLSNMVYCKPRPFNIANDCKKAGKKIIVEFSEMHPEHTYAALKKDYLTYGITSEYIFTSRYAINESIKTIAAADKIIILSEASQQSFLSHGVDAAKLVVINPGFTGSTYTPQRTGKPKAFISTAFHSFVKGTHRLLLAWKEANITNMPLIIAGNLQSDMTEFIHKYGPFHSVEFIGNVNIAELYNQYNAVGILNSLSEGYGRSVIEYMAHGYPVLVSPAATCDIVDDYQHGLIAHTTENLVQHMKYFSENPEEITRMGNIAHNAVSNMNIKYEEKLLTFIKEYGNQQC